MSMYGSAMLCPCMSMSDEEDGDHTISSEETLRLELARLKEYVKELESEHQLERDKGKVCSYQYLFIITLSSAVAD